MKGQALGADSPYLDPLSDAGFKRLFGNDAPKSIVVNFLNALLRGERIIRDFEPKPITADNAYPRPGEILYDLLCVDEKGERFIVHLQRSAQETVYPSLRFHGSRLIAEQPAPDESNNGYLMNVYSIGLINFDTQDNGNSDCLNDYRLRWVSTGELFSDLMNIFTVELPKFAKGEDELETDLDQWLFLLKNMGGMTEIPDSLKGAEFEEVFRAVAT